MTTPRVYLPQALKIGSKITLPPEISHHLLHVLRLRNGDKLFLFNGQDAGGEFVAEFVVIAEKHGTATAIKRAEISSTSCAVVTLHEWQQRASESPLTLHLGQSIIANAKMDYTIQKAVELGVSCITPLFTIFGNVKLADERLSSRLERWQKVAIHASEQCGRCQVPRILPAQHLEKWLPSLPKSDTKITLAPKAELSITALPPTTSNITLLAGAEGGLSAEETALAQQHGFVACRMGQRILRAETAALVALSILQSQYGDMR